MFNLGWGEIALIGIVALIAIGPKELPTVLRTVGQMLAKVRRMASEFQGQFQEALREADIADLKKHADDIVSDVSKFDPLGDTQKDIEKSLALPDPMAEPAVSSNTASDFRPDAPAEALPAPGEQAPESGVTDGASLPEGVLPAIDVPLPDPPPAFTEKDFAEAPAATALPDSEPPKESAKRAGGKA
jgi:sec-independent protein translocase protein TatB